MRPQPARRPVLCLAGATLCALAVELLGTAPPAAAQTPEPAATEQAQPAGDAEPADAAPPRLGEVAQSAFQEVLDAARRDGASWARRTQALKQRALDGLADGSRRLWSDPTGTVDGWLLGAGLPDSQTLAIPALVLLAGLIGLLVRIRGSGTLKVSIEYPAELRGTFSVRITRKPQASRRGPRTASPAAAQRARQGAGASSRTERHLVSRETDLTRVRTGRWFVTVDGFVQPPDDEAVIATHFEEREVRMRRGHTVRVDFDFRPKQCPVDVRVVWDDQPVHDGLVAWQGQPHSLRYARGGPVRLGAELGNHTLMVGARDRVAQIPVSVTAFQPQAVEVDLGNRERLLFTGCPHAVEPYLHGDLRLAVRALEREGDDATAHLILAREHESRQDRERAAHHYEEAGRPLVAAEIRRELSQYRKSAALYETAGELLRAGEMYRSAGEVQKAGETFLRARDYPAAADCFRNVGDVSRWVEALERAGTPFQAARVALDHGDESRAIRSLQLLSPDDADYLEAAQLLVEILERQGHLDLALEKVEEIFRNLGPESVPLQTLDRLARLLVDAEEFDRARYLLDTIRRRDAAFPNIATRLEEVRKRQQRRDVTARTLPGTGSTPVPGAEAFVGGPRYDILEEVGRGGMGVVFKARDRRLGRVVALKRLPENLRNHPRAVELFLREARSAAALNHPNIVTVHDAGQEGDTFYITMELLEGHPLQKILRHNGKLGVRDVVRLGIQVAKGLEYAHGRRIIHRDIKTANLFFTVGKTLKVMDFGLAKMVEEVRRDATVIGGTPYYMAPEQALGEAVDHRSDLYSLGVTLFELLTGKVPFPDGDVAYHHRHTPPPDPREKVAGIPDALAELVLEMLAKRAEDRPRSAEVVRVRLQTILDRLSSGG